ncbi:MAG TPA: hypothetical protein VHN77_00185 [Phycisphaerales bacterium]|nr:hypothetical protein [Phycisphaerales bacterium]
MLSYPPVFPDLRAISTDGTKVLTEHTGGAKSGGWVSVWAEVGPGAGVWAGGIGYQTYSLAVTPDFSAIAVGVPGGCFGFLNLSTYDYNFARAVDPFQDWSVRVTCMNADASIMAGFTGSPPVYHRWDNHVPSLFPSLVGRPIAMNNDASVIVTDERVWTPLNSSMSHRDYLTSRGARFAPGAVQITTVSSDLSAFAGLAPSPTGPGQQRFIIQFRTSGCDSIDFNNDGLLPDVHDIQEFLSVFGGQDCGTATCNDIDFNNDGMFPDVEDINAFIRVFAGGSCE